VDRDKRSARWYLERIGAIFALAALLIFTLNVTGKDDATNTETALWTFILFAVGIGVSFYFGKKSTAEAARDIVRPQAKAAARRLVTLGAGLAAIKAVLDRHRSAARITADDAGGDVPVEDFNLAYESIEIHIDLQKQMVVDALEDWRHFDPEIATELLEEDKGG